MIVIIMIITDAFLSFLSLCVSDNERPASRVAAAEKTPAFLLRQDRMLSDAPPGTQGRHESTVRRSPFRSVLVTSKLWAIVLYVCSISE